MRVVLQGSPIAITSDTGTAAKRARQSQLEGTGHGREEMGLRAQEDLTMAASGNKRDLEVLKS